MSPAELRAFLVESGLSQGGLAKLLDVSPRAVGFWLSEERAIPGAVDAYARLFLALPPGLRQAEMRRLRETKPTMRDGMYAVTYHDPARTSYGYGTVVFDNGKIYGADPAGGRYDGDYTYDDASQLATIHIKVAFPPNVAAVFAPAQPFEWSVDMSGVINPRVDKGFIELATTLGKVQAEYQFLRELPSTAA